MKRLLLASAIAVALPLSAHATAVLVANDGLTYSLTENSISSDGLTADFTFTATGYNTSADLDGGTNAGRASVEAFAFNQPSPGTVVSGSVTSPPGYTFELGGLNSTGCNGNGNFFCFDNTAAPSTPPLTPGTLTFNFSVTANTAGVWNSYTTDMKINWDGSQNNYSLVSQPIPVNDCTAGQCGTTRIAVPEPGSISLLGSGLALIGMFWLGRRRRKSLPVQTA